MIVLCIEGVHGAGKSYMIQKCQQMGLSTLDEAFIGSEEKITSTLHPQSFVMESLWVAKWFERLLKIQHHNASNPNAPLLYVADRSPFSAVFYAQQQSGFALRTWIEQMIHHLHVNANITVITIYLHVPQDVLWKRISQRLIQEPHRKQFNEHKREWMQYIYTLYHEFDWDYVISNEIDHDPSLLSRFFKNVSKHASFATCKLPEPMQAYLHSVQSPKAK